MRYAVVGLGAVGSVIGGLLAKSGMDVVLIGKEKQIEAINNKEIEINNINGKNHIENIHVTPKLTSLNNVDVIFVCVKSNDTQRLANNLRKHVKKSALIISLQNGIRNAKILNDTAGNRTLSGIVLFNALYSKPGRVTLTMKGGILLEHDRKYEYMVNPLLSSLNNEGLKSRTVENIEGLLWSKLILNLQNPVTALTGQTIKQSIIDKTTREILVATMKEGMYVVENSGITLETLPNINPRRMIRWLNLFNSSMIKIGTRLIRLNENARNSMAQSLSRGKQTEIDYINGEIVNLAKQNNLKSPINKKLVELVKQAERRYSTKSYEPSKLMGILGL